MKLQTYKTMLRTLGLLGLLLMGVAQAAPTIAIQKPLANDLAFAPASEISIMAYATPSPGTSITSVKFYRGTTLLGSAGTDAAPPYYHFGWFNVPAGSYSLTAKATDSTGAVTTSAAVPIVVDALPTVSLTAPAANAVFAAPTNITLTANAADTDGTISKVEFYRGSTLIGTDTTAPYSITWSNAAAGNYSLTAKATDNRGAVTTSAAVAIVVDTPPTVSLTAPAANAVFTAPASITLSANAADTDGTVAKVDFYQGSTLIGTDTTAPYSATWTNAPAGSYSLTAKATDNKGVITSVAIPIVVNGVPTVSLTAPVANAVFAAPANITLTANAADADGTISKVEFYRGSTLIGTDTTAPYSITWSNAAAGNYSLTAKATDNRGAVTTSAAVAIVVDTPPTVSLTAPAANAVFAAPATITLSANAADTDGTVTKVDFYQGSTLIGTDTTAPYSVIWSNAPAGNYSLTAKATDNKGVTTSAAIPIVVNGVPTVSLTAPSANTVFTAPANITISANAADTNGTVAKVDFYQGSTLIGTDTTAPYSVTWSNAPAGSYNLTAKASDNQGAVTTSAAIPIVVNGVPTVSLTAPLANALFTDPATITLSANAADTNGTVAKVDFYQGTTLIGTDTTAPYSVTWSNAAAGNYSLTAKVTDNQGAVTTSAAVAIVVDTPPTVSLTAPAANAVFTAPASITISANAADADGTISKVDFYQGATLIGTDTSAPYSITWSNVPAGSYSLTAKATDNQGITQTSVAVALTVSPNQSPTVSISTPTPAQRFAAPATVTVTADASDGDGTLSRVEFYQGTTLLGTATSAPYSIVWESVPEGNYSLTAKAVDNGGGEAVSAAVGVSVERGATVYYLHNDHLNTPRLVTDDQNRVVWRNQPLNEPFGNSPPEEDPDGDGQNFSLNLRFPGQYFDKETNLAYNYYRDYDPLTGRYIQSDPIGLQGGINTYGYVGGNPLRLIDPMGLSSDDPMGGSGTRPPVGIPDPSAQAQQDLARQLTQMLRNLADKMCPTNEGCPPCTPYAEGTLGYQGPEVHSRGMFAGESHYHIFIVRQNKSDCKCYWNTAPKRDFGHQYFDRIEPGWINLNGSARPPSYPH